MWIIIIVISIIMIPILNGMMEGARYERESKILKDPNASEELKREIRHTRYLERKEQNAILEKKQAVRMSQSCKFENVYGTYKDTSLDSKKLSLRDSYIAYETNSGISCFAISYDDIVDAKCDTTENLTAMRFLALGVLAFAFKKKTYYTVITYKDDLTNSDQQLIFRVDNPSNKDDFINNLLIKRNQYLMEHKKTV